MGAQWTKCGGTVGQKPEKEPKTENWKNGILSIPIESYDFANNVKNNFFSKIIRLRKNNLVVGVTRPTLKKTCDSSLFYDILEK